MAQANAKSNSVITGAWSQDGTVLTINVLGSGSPPIFFDRKTVGLGGPLDTEAARQGWYKRLVNAAALDRGATPRQKWEAVRELADYYAGNPAQWSRAAADPARPDPGLVIAAMIRVYPDQIPDVDAANSRLADTATQQSCDRDAAIALWANSTKIAPMMVVIRKEREARAMQERAERPAFDPDAFLNRIPRE